MPSGAKRYLRDGKVGSKATTRGTADSAGVATPSKLAAVITAKAAAVRRNPNQWGLPSAHDALIADRAGAGTPAASRDHQPCSAAKWPGPKVHGSARRRDVLLRVHCGERCRQATGLRREPKTAQPNRTNHRSHICRAETRFARLAPSYQALSAIRLLQARQAGPNRPALNSEATAEPGIAIANLRVAWAHSRTGHRP